MSEDQSGSEAAEEKQPRTGAKEIEGAARKGPKPLRGKGRDTEGHREGSHRNFWVTRSVQCA